MGADCPPPRDGFFPAARDCVPAFCAAFLDLRVATRLFPVTEALCNLTERGAILQGELLFL
jgi:hypothetical protein